MLDFRHKKRPQLRSIYILMVPKAGLEPARISTVDFESTASTDFATSALQVVCGKRVHYTFQRSTCNTYPLFNELSAEKIVAGVTLGSFFGRSKACRSGITVAHGTGAACSAPTEDIGDNVHLCIALSAVARCRVPRNKKGVTAWLRLFKSSVVPLLAF
jgi:hypothetical protein